MKDTKANYVNSTNFHSIFYPFPIKTRLKINFSVDSDREHIRLAALGVDNLFVKVVKFLKKIEKVVNQEEQQLIDFLNREAP